ncbi:DUF4260 domain-containing protein [Sinomicrobium soli]|uniref:DUF4260 domain-containing protein n=1 Tax=Sinomicrobium sp. N-1-3-6 TaxID=2219864 RepID=UPI000DCC463A|nr:DUF4260 domain-containing protein [Sinomicrobium sp. N-1-3-6]RAV28974.1 DUF4260 domain-containing protein [Sinomicrobium sp. N-1-3-6]
MKTLLKLEEAAILLFCIFLFSKLNFAWWWFPALLLLPDIGMIGYVVNRKVGAFTYNLTHHRLIATMVALYAITYGNDSWKLTAVILFAHISFDRTLGYGLKYNDNFQHTHLGTIGKKSIN